MLRTAEAYLASLRDGREVYYRGRRVDDVTLHPALGIAARHNARIFQLARCGPLAGRLSWEAAATGEAICTFYRPPASPEQLLERSELIAETTRRSRGIFNICKVIGSDALFALLSVTARAARGSDGGTSRGPADPALAHERVRRYLDRVAREDLALAVAQTDVKGHRDLRPHQQPDPDLYVRVVRVLDEGIVVRGAKAHTTQAPVADELVVIPGRAMQVEDADWSVAFAVAASTPGVRMICRPLLEVEAAGHPLEGPRVLQDALVEALVVFDDVLVPWERVFVCRDPAAATRTALAFAQWHRFSAISYRSAMGELLVGLARATARANGVEGKSHIRRRLVELILYAELQRMAAEQAARHALRDEATGLVMPHPLPTNLGKLYSNTHYLQAVEAVIDCAGGLAITAPSGHDYQVEDLRALIDRYLAGADTPGGRRFRLFLAVRELVGLLGGLESVTMVHAEGSVEASIIETYRSYDFGPAERQVEELLEPADASVAAAADRGTAGAGGAWPAGGQPAAS